MLKLRSDGNYQNYFSFPVLDSFYTEKTGLIVTGDVLTGSIEVESKVEIIRPSSVLNATISKIIKLGGEEPRKIGGSDQAVGLVFEDLMSGQVIRGDLVRSIIAA